METSYHEIGPTLARWSELIVVELGAYAAYFGDPLPKPDLDRVLLAIRKLEALRGVVNARIK